MMNASQEYEDVTSVSVLWNIEKCPVPPSVDACRVGPCIKRFLEKSGYSGPHTITAMGLLTDVPDEVLRAVSSTGIVLHIDPFGSPSLSSHVVGLTIDNKPPANLMVITDPTDRDIWDHLNLLEEYGYNIIDPYPWGPASTNEECLWENFLLAESEKLEEDKCIETVESVWVCTVCDPIGDDFDTDLTGQGFGDFTTHISSKEHALAKLSWLTPEAGCDEGGEYSYDPKIAAQVEPQPQSLGSFPQHLQRFHSPSECPYAYATPVGMHQPKAKPWESFPQDTRRFHPPSECPYAYATPVGMEDQRKLLSWECFHPHPHMFATPDECKRCHLGTTIMGTIQSKTGEYSPPHPHMFGKPSESCGKDEPEASSNI